MLLYLLSTSRVVACFFNFFFHKTLVNCLIFLNHWPVSETLLIKDTECKYIPEKIGLNLKYYKIKIFCWHLKKKWFWVVRRGTTSSWSSGSLTTTKNETLNCWTPHGIDIHQSGNRTTRTTPTSYIIIAISASNSSLQWVYWWNRVLTKVVFGLSPGQKL